MRWESFDRDLGAVKRSLMRFSDKSLSVPAPHAQSSANLIKVCKLCVWEMLNDGVRALERLDWGRLGGKACTWETATNDGSRADRGGCY